MEASIIQIGNSKGLRLNKQLLEQYHISDKVEMILEKDHIILRPIKKVREGWDHSFKEMSANSDDELLIDDVFPEDDFEEWN